MRTNYLPDQWLWSVSGWQPGGSAGFPGQLLILSQPFPPPSLFPFLPEPLPLYMQKVQHPPVGLEVEGRSARDLD